MTEAYNSKFFKADTRTPQTLPGSRCYRTGLQNSVTVNDYFLSPDTSVTIILEPDDLNIILPVVGNVILKSEDKALSPEELFCYCGPTGLMVSIKNPFADETVNFLHISVSRDAHRMEYFAPCISSLPVNRKNALIAGNGQVSNIQLGVYDSRTKDKLALKEGCSGLFSYVINGSFDFEERLMEYRDGLYQWGVQEVDFEALSETAVLLLIECSPQN